MKVELWGTFSVRDHLRRRPFVADVLLYDRLVIPRPPMPEEEPREPGEENQVARWRREGWKPGRLDRLLDILREGDLAVELPWGARARQDWDDLYRDHGSGAPRIDAGRAAEIGAKRAALANSARVDIAHMKHSAPDHAPYIITGGLIATYVANGIQNEVAQRLVALSRTPGTDVEPVVAYGSFRTFRDEQSLRPAVLGPSPEALQPYALFGWEFFVPDDTRKGDHELLRAAVRLASRPDFRETRQSFHGWLKQMHDGDVDPAAARANMRRMLEEHRAIVRGSGLKTGLRYAAKAAPVLAPLATLLGAAAGIGAGVVAGVAGLCIERLVPESRTDERFRPAALVHDARRFFGKKR